MTTVQRAVSGLKPFVQSQRRQHEFQRADYRLQALLLQVANGAPLEVYDLYIHNLIYRKILARSCLFFSSLNFLLNHVDFVSGHERTLILLVVFGFERKKRLNH